MPMPEENTRYADSLRSITLGLINLFDYRTLPEDHEAHDLVAQFDELEGREYVKKIEKAITDCIIREGVEMWTEPRGYQGKVYRTAKNTTVVHLNDQAEMILYQSNQDETYYKKVIKCNRHQLEQFIEALRQQFHTIELARTNKVGRDSASRHKKKLFGIF